MASMRAGLARAFAAQVGRIDLLVATPDHIPKGMTFREWCSSLSKPRRDPVSGKMRPALLVDGKRFALDDRPAMAWVYDQIPSTREEARGGFLILRKCAQVGFTVMEMLATIYLALKFDALKIGMFVPSRDLAATKSAQRFMPIVRTVPEAYEMLADDGREGNVMVRRMGNRLFHFLWTSSATATESNPMDVVTFDEVQEMAIADMERARERLSASSYKFTLMGSTANWPDGDIDYWYKKGSQHRFHTRCPTCGVEEPLDDYFPACIKFDPDLVDPITRLPGEYRYVCRAGHWIDDPQQGQWKADNPDAAARKIISVHFHQMLSPTISAREMIEAYRSADDMKNFHNRKLGKPYQDPSQLPVSLEHLNRCVAEGAAAGVVWKKRAKGTFMGIDQMGAFNVVVIKERLPDGRQAVIHVEAIYSNDPFARCDQLMKDYGVQVCVVEQLPNFNDAMRFANRHERKVFLCSGYDELSEGVVRWSDGPSLSASERRTNEDERTRFTVRIDQFKAMSLSLKRLAHTHCLFPDPQELVQEIREKEARFDAPILKDMAFPHFQKTALVTERIKAGERRLRRSVLKVGIDPHFSYANMLCDVAWARAHGTAHFHLPSIPEEAPPEPPSGVVQSAKLSSLIATVTNSGTEKLCGSCIHYPLGADGVPASAYCPMIEMQTAAEERGCDLHTEG